MPAGYAPFNIAAIGGNLVVTFALRNGTGRDAATGAGDGYVDVFAPNGGLLHRLVSNGPLDAPYGLAHGDLRFRTVRQRALLVGNVGDGRINAFNLATGAFLGSFATPTFDVHAESSGLPLAIDGLRGLAFGLGMSSETLFFASGPNGGADGLVGALTDGLDLAVVADAALHAVSDFSQLVNPATPLVEGKAFSGDVATFRDDNPLAAASNFTATTTWGDGLVTAASIKQDGSDPTLFHVSDSHTYNEQGTYTIGVTIKDVGGSTLTVGSPNNAVVTDAPLTASVTTVAAIEGINYNRQVAAFTDGNPNATSTVSPSDAYTATIDWGDGSSPTQGTVMAASTPGAGSSSSAARRTARRRRASRRSWSW